MFLSALHISAQSASSSPAGGWNFDNAVGAKRGVSVRKSHLPDRFERASFYEGAPPANLSFLKRRYMHKL